MFPNGYNFLSANFTRPADVTAYASGDLAANSVTAGSVVPLTFANATNGPGFAVQVRRVRIGKSGTGVANAAFRVHLYTASPTPANGDNGVWSTSGAASYLGSIDVTVDKAFTDGAAGQATGEINCKASAANQTLYGLLEVRGAYTPASAEVFTVTLELAQQ